jgi:hypothetical protein
MTSVQTLRHILMGGAAVAAVIGLVTGQMLVAVVMGVGFLAHLALSVHLRRTGALPPTAGSATAAAPPADLR